MPILDLLLACAAPPADTDVEAQDTVDTADTGGRDPCEALTIDVTGPQPPRVGDTWTVWLYCDEALETGSMVLRFDPPDFATIDANSATFLYAGQATMRVQVGSLRAEEPVEVGE